MENKNIISDENLIKVSGEKLMFHQRVLLVM